jgi:hypothetical protein
VVVVVLVVVVVVLVVVVVVLVVVGVVVVVVLVVVGVVVVVVLVVVVVVVVGPAQVPSTAQASNLLKKPRKAPQALPVLHLLADPAIDAFTWSRLFSEQHTTAFGLPQIEAFSHFMISLRHDFCGMSAVRSAAFRLFLTHFSYLPCVWPLRVQPQVLSIICRAFSMAVESEHFVLTHAPNAGGTVACNKKGMTPATMNQRMLRSPFPRVRRRASKERHAGVPRVPASTLALKPVNTPAKSDDGCARTGDHSNTADSRATIDSRSFRSGCYLTGNSGAAIYVGVALIAPGPAPRRQGDAVRVLVTGSVARASPPWRATGAGQ